MDAVALDQPPLPDQQAQLVAADTAGRRRRERLGRDRGYEGMVGQRVCAAGGAGSALAGGDAVDGVDHGPLEVVEAGQVEPEWPGAGHRVGELTPGVLQMLGIHRPPSQIGGAGDAGELLQERRVNAAPLGDHPLHRSVGAGP